MKKQKYLPCFNCYKHYSNTNTTICIAAFPCIHLARRFIMYYMDYIEPIGDSDSISYYIKKESVAKFIDF